MPELTASLKPVIRKLEPTDRDRVTRNAALEDKAFQFCLQRIQARQLPMKLIRVEYAFDAQKATFYFSAEGRIDFRELVKDLASYLRIRVEMRQLGARDEAKMTCGMGICGRELCCSTFLTCFAPISIKMAKEQGLALNPSKISGMCGRLRCCLSYEYETYRAISAKLPKLGKRIETAAGVGKVVKLEILKEKVTVEMEDGRVMSFQASDLAKVST
jgi:cell fate regulator YaaT (PSP1 superfamily)